MAKILVAEDESDIRDLIKFTLQYAGHQISLAENGAHALDVCRAVMPELILMDVRMPKLTGYEACVQMKADPLICHIPVVFLSAKGQDQEVQTGLAVGAVEYILKPFSPHELIIKVAAILMQHANSAAR
jgi:CheY-like chemotaxis protein